MRRCDIGWTLVETKCCSHGSVPQVSVFDAHRKSVSEMIRGVNERLKFGREASEETCAINNGEEVPRGQLAELKA